MSAALPEALPREVQAWLKARAAELGVKAPAPTADLFEQGLLDSMGVAALVAHVESHAGCEIDFLEVDPEALNTLDGVVTELLRVARAR